MTLFKGLIPKSAFVRKFLSTTTAPGAANNIPSEPTQRVNTTAAFGLSLAGLVIQIISAMVMIGFFLAYPYFRYGGGFMFGGMMGGGYFGFPNMMGFGYSYFPWMFGVNIIATSAVIVLGAIGVVILRSGADPSRITLGSVLIVVAAIIAYPTMWGFALGSLLMLIGGILGLTTAATAK